MTIIQMDTFNNFLNKILSFGLICFALGFIYPQPVKAFQNLPRPPKPAPKFPVHQPISPKPNTTIGKRPKVDLSNVGALPDLVIVQVKPKLHAQAIQACKTGKSPYGRLVGFDLKVKNVGSAVADLRHYNFAVHAISVDGQSPKMKGGDGYRSARRTPANITPGQTFNIKGASGVDGTYYAHGRPVSFPVSRFSELAGKTRRFNVEIISGKKYGHGLPESNYKNNSKTVRFTFPRDFCKATVKPVRPRTQQPGKLKHHLVIQSITPNFTRPYECRPDGPTFATMNVKVKNTGSDFSPTSTRLYKHQLTLNSTIKVGNNSLNLRGLDQIKITIPAGQTRQIPIRMTATRGVLNVAAPSSSVLAGKTLPVLSFIDIDIGHSDETKEEQEIRPMSQKNFKIRFPKDFCAAKAVGRVSQPIGSALVVKPKIKGFQFAGGKQCVSPGGIFTIKGSAFGKKAAGRAVEIGGNRQHQNVTIKSWSERSIRVQLPRNTQLRYNKNYWISINSKKDKKGLTKHLSNLKRGIKLCPPTVRVGSSANQTTVHQGGGNVVNVNVSGGLPDLEVTRLSIGNPSPSCFSLSPHRGGPKYYTLPTLKVNLTLHNKGRVPYSTLDTKHNKQLPIGIIGERYVEPKDKHNISLCLVPVARLRFSNLNIPAGGNKTVQTQMQLMRCPFRGGKVVNQNGLIPDQRVRALLGKTRNIAIGIGKAVFIHNKIPEESNYDNNYGHATFKFPSSTCNGR